MQTTYRENLSLSVPSMDQEHGELIAQESEFSAAVEAEASRAELAMLLTRLIGAFQDHFESEEELMRSNGFLGWEPHLEEHRKLLGQLSGLRDDLDSGSVNRCFALAHFVRLWSEQHMKGSDSTLAHFLHNGQAGRGTALVSIEQ